LSTLLDDSRLSKDSATPSKVGLTKADAQLQQQISDILESVPAKIRLTSEPNHLNPPDFAMPTAATAAAAAARKSPRNPEPVPRSQSSLSIASNSSRAATPSFTLAPAFGRNSRLRGHRDHREIKLYHLSRSNGEAPIKLFIRCVGEKGERVMVRVGGGWADLGEYLKEYASHHGRRSGGETGKIEVKDVPNSTFDRSSVLSRAGSAAASSPMVRPQSAQDSYSSPVTPLNIRKTRRTTGTTAEELMMGFHRGRGSAAAAPAQKASPAFSLGSATSGRITEHTPSPPGGRGGSRSRSSSRIDWGEEEVSLGMAGPRAKQIEMSEESKKWVESVKEKVRIASGDLGKVAGDSSLLETTKFGEMGKVGSTKRLYRRQI